MILMCRQGKESSLRFSEYRCYIEHAHFGEEMAGINGEKLKADTYLLNIYYTHIHRASQVVQVVKNLPANAEDLRDVGSIHGSGRSPK